MKRQIELETRSTVFKAVSQGGIMAIDDNDEERELLAELEQEPDGECISPPWSEIGKWSPSAPIFGAQAMARPLGTGRPTLATDSGEHRSTDPNIHRGEQ
jgi:hypothetical protein